MSQKALIRRRGVEAVLPFSSAEATALGLKVQHFLPQGVLVAADDPAGMAAVEKAGYRVKLLPDTHLLIIGRYRIDIGRKPPKVPAGLEVPSNAAKTWPHHLIQLAGPADPEWVARIEKTGVNVVEPVSAYGLFVVGLPEQMTRLKEELDCVAWTGPFKPAYRISPSLAGKTGLLDSVGITVYPREQVDVVKKALARAKAELQREATSAAAFGGEFGVLHVRVDAKQIPLLACLPPVRWLEYEPPMETMGERETQIVAENLNGVAAPNSAPVVGYQAALTAAGLNGNGVTIAIADTGVDAGPNNNVNAHADLQGRQAAFVDYTGGATTTDTDGHGTNVAGIALGNAASGQVDAAAPANFLWGQGMAPSANYVTQNFLLANPQPTVVNLIRDASTNGAQVMNNSWGVNNSGGSGYGANSRVIDQAVRDPNNGTAALEYLVIVCAAGNDGGAASTISSPHESKNDIVVGNSLTARPGVGFPSDDIRGISGTSGRGPAMDGRILPVVVAPGTDVSAAFSRTSTRAPIAGTGTADPANPGQTINRYIFMSGTSQATPHVAGSCALLIDWWRQRTGGRNPSPALLKALLVNGAEDLAGGPNWRCLSRTTVDKATWSLQAGNIFRRNMAFVPAAVVDGATLMTQVAALANINAAGQWAFDAAANRLFVRMFANTNPGAAGTNFVTARDTVNVPAIPNGHQGWGRISLPNMTSQAPASDRGPKIFSDQRHAFTTNGQEFLIRVAPAATARPLRVTLTWTDAAGANGANPALVNDLDLEVTETATGSVLRGNVFNNGVSVTGGVFDTRNNVECVIRANPAGTYEVRVLASSITASARPDIATPWQDFALVIDNAVVPSAAPIAVVPVIDRSGSMIVYGYEAITRTASKQFVDLLGVGDRLGVVSFGDSGVVEYPAGPGPVLQTIAGPPEQALADSEIDGIVFGGCTFMGDGILRGRDLLAPAAGARAMVLLSDGFDNKGCQQGNPALPSAADAVAQLPAGLPVYTCAMGPTADQALLDQIAASSAGRYYYMPTIDDLFEIYNYIRGQVSGDAIVANESASASASRVAAFVDAGAAQCVFSVAWGNEKIRYTPNAPRKTVDVAVRLRDPRGLLLPPHDSYVRRIVGAGYVIFEIQDPMPGRWYVEVETAGDTHVRYTVGGFVQSPLRLVLVAKPLLVSAGFPVQIAARVLLGKKPVPGVRASALIRAPGLSLKNLAETFRKELEKIKPIGSKGDAIPPDIGRLLALRKQMLAAGGKDIFATVDTKQALKVSSTGIASLPLTATMQQGSYNVAVVVQGNSPANNTRFVRKDLLSVLVR